MTCPVTIRSGMVPHLGRKQIVRCAIHGYLGYAEDAAMAQQIQTAHLIKHRPGRTA